MENVAKDSSATVKDTSIGAPTTKETTTNAPTAASKTQSGPGTSGSTAGSKKEVDPADNRMSGHIPNIARYAVPIDDLREHPNFDDLPHPTQVPLREFNGLYLYRKDSWQYQLLLKGRLNCNRIASVLGFFEEKTQEKLKVPANLVSHARVRKTWDHLQSSPIPDYSMLQRSGRNHKFIKREQRKWKQTQKSIWLYDFEPFKNSAANLYSRISGNRGGSRATKVNVAYGRAQDSVGLLAAVNMFGKLGGHVKEVGMLPLEAVGLPPHFNVAQRALRLPLMSASPHAILEWYNQTIETLSVISICPFVRAPNQPQSSSPLYEVKDKPPFENIPPWMYPQIQFQIYCAGHKCTSCIVVSYSATKGMNVFRVNKNERYIDDMLCWIQMFYAQYIFPNPNPPKENFFNDIPSYEEFLSKTVEFSNAIPVLYRIPIHAIQRSPLQHPANSRWFLDDLPSVAKNNFRRGKARRGRNRDRNMGKRGPNTNGTEQNHAPRARVTGPQTSSAPRTVPVKERKYPVTASKKVVTAPKVTEVKTKPPPQTGWAGKVAKPIAKEGVPKKTVAHAWNLS